MKSYIFFWSHRAQLFLEWEMLQTKIIEKIKTHILCSITFLNRKSYRWCDNVEDIVEAGGPQMTILRTRIECWITKATHTHTQYVILTAPALQQCLHERASMLRYAYIA